MTYSMTAFARVQSQQGTSSFCWELKSVNHRYLDVSFRMPESFRFLEMNLRSFLRHHVQRGKLECQLKFNGVMDENQSIVINSGLVRSLLDAGSTLASTLQIANDLSASQLLAWPGVIQINQPKIETLAEEVELVFQEGLKQLLAARLAEGNMLKAHLKTRIDLLQEEITAARTEVALISGQTKDKLLKRLDMIQMDAMETRIEQEIAMMLTRLDVSEELDRLETHLYEVTRTIDRNEAAGRRLDFLMQELHREANTLSAKSDTVTLTQHAVEMKVLIEQMREQIQNIE